MSNGSLEKKQSLSYLFHRSVWYEGERKRKEDSVGGLPYYYSARNENPCERIQGSRGDISVGEGKESLVLMMQ